MIWRIGLIDSCGGLAGIGAAGSDRAASIADAAAFIDLGDRVECRETVADPTGHGTRIAELLACGPRIESSCRIELLLGQVFTTCGPTSGAAVAAAIDWALERRASLIHLSLGLAGDRPVLGSAVGRALDAGCILVAAMPARGATVYPAAYPGVIRATGDARCAPHELSALRPWFFGGCPRLEAASRTGSGLAAGSGAGSGAGSDAGNAADSDAGSASGGARGGASIGAAWVTHAILREPPLTAPGIVEALTAQAKYLGPEHRTAVDQNG